MQRRRHARRRRRRRRRRRDGAFVRGRLEEALTWLSSLPPILPFLAWLRISLRGSIL